MLVHVFRRQSPRHEEQAAWLRSEVDSGAPFGMSPQVLASLIRIVTYRGIFADPDPVERAIAFADALLNHPNCRLIQPGPRHWAIFTDLCRKSGTAGNLVQDAWLAARAIESGCEFITLDRDFARFPGLRWRAPSRS